MAYLRPDEEANAAAVERAQRTKGYVQQGAKAALGAGAAIAGGAIAEKIMPFLSSYIPTGLAIKGISKISPKLGDFLKRGESFGLDPKEGIDFIRSGIEKSGKKAEEATGGNILGEFSPELQEFVESQLREGRTPEQAGALAQSQGQFLPIIQQMKKKTGKNFLDILMHQYGQTAAQPQNAQQQQGQQQQGNWGAIAEMLKQTLAS